LPAADGGQHVAQPVVVADHAASVFALSRRLVSLRLVSLQPVKRLPATSLLEPAFYLWGLSLAIRQCSESLAQASGTPWSRCATKPSAKFKAAKLPVYH